MPVDLDSETKLDPEIRSWLAFALQKLAELKILAQALNKGRSSVQEALVANHAAVEQRRTSPRVHNPARQGRAGRHRRRARPARQRLCSSAPRSKRRCCKLPPFPTTTIGSFPQTAEIRQARRRFRQGELDAAAYGDADAR